MRKEGKDSLWSGFFHCAVISSVEPSSEKMSLSNAGLYPTIPELVKIPHTETESSSSAARWGRLQRRLLPRAASTTHARRFRRGSCSCGVRVTIVRLSSTESSECRRLPISSNPQLTTRKPAHGAKVREVGIGPVQRVDGEREEVTITRCALGEHHNERFVCVLTVRVRLKVVEPGEVGSATA